MKTKAVALNELYDNLSPDMQAVWDSIGTLGFKPEKGAAGLWMARSKSDRHRVVRRILRNDRAQIGEG